MAFSRVSFFFFAQVFWGRAVSNANNHYQYIEPIPRQLNCNRTGLTEDFLVNAATIRNTQVTNRSHFSNACVHVSPKHECSSMMVGMREVERNNC